jgi:hypothetical protein
MSRYTATKLKIDLDEINAYMKHEGNYYQFKYDHRNGYHAVDLIAITPTETIEILNIDCFETPQKLYERALSESHFWKTQTYK